MRAERRRPTRQHAVTRQPQTEWRSAAAEREMIRSRAATDGELFLVPNAAETIGQTVRRQCESRAGRADEDVDRTLTVVSADGVHRRADYDGIAPGRDCVAEPIGRRAVASSEFLPLNPVPVEGGEDIGGTLIGV